MSFKMYICNKIKKWLKDTKAVTAMESAFIFPVLATFLLGVVDVGTSVVINTKVITATQIASDLITRDSIATTEDINEARLAAEAALIPYFDASEFGIDIAGVLFVGEEALPAEQWRDTFNMPANTAAIAQTSGLGLENEGVVVVTVEYRFEPRFAYFITGDILMREVSFVKGRDSAYVDRQ